MRNKRRWLACVAAAMGVSSAGCQTWVGGMTLPSPRYLQHYPQYFSPDPAFPLPRELASQEDPEGAARRGGLPAIGGGPGGGAGLNPAGQPVPVGPGN